MTTQRYPLIALAVALAWTVAQPSLAQVSNSANTLRLGESATSPAAAIEELSWLAGYWTGEGLGGTCEEMWSPPVGDRMLGIFSLRKQGELVFSEAMALVEEAGSVALKVKHFTREFVGWEEKEDFVTFPLVRLGENEAYFSGLTFRRNGDNLSIFLVLSSQGERTEQEFRLKRSPLK